MARINRDLESSHGVTSELQDGWRILFHEQSMQWSKLLDNIGYVTHEITERTRADMTLQQQATLTTVRAQMIG